MANFSTPSRRCRQHESNRGISLGPPRTGERERREVGRETIATPRYPASRDGACFVGFTRGAVTRPARCRKIRSHISVFRRQFYVQLARHAPRPEDANFTAGQGPRPRASFFVARSDGVRVQNSRSTMRNFDNTPVHAIISRARQPRRRRPAILTLNSPIYPANGGFPVVFSLAHRKLQQAVVNWLVIEKFCTTAGQRREMMRADLGRGV